MEEVLNSSPPDLASTSSHLTNEDPIAETSYGNAPHWHSHNHEIVGNRSIQAGGRTIQHVKGWGEGNGCVVTCIAAVANISFGEARRAAIDAVNFEPGGDGLDFKEAQTILENFGIESRRYRYKNGIDWSDLPDIAFVTVYGPGGGAHAVVFVRSNNGEFIFDMNKDGPVSCNNYKLDPDDAYLEILNRPGNLASTNSHLTNEDPIAETSYGHAAHWHSECQWGACPQKAV